MGVRDALVKRCFSGVVCLVAGVYVQGLQEQYVQLGAWKSDEDGAGDDLVDRFRCRLLGVMVAGSGARAYSTVQRGHEPTATVCLR
jgi:hypothetical protein